MRKHARLARFRPHILDASYYSKVSMQHARKNSLLAWGARARAAPRLLVYRVTRSICVAPWLQLQLTGPFGRLENSWLQISPSCPDPSYYVGGTIRISGCTNQSPGSNFRSWKRSTRRTFTLLPWCATGLPARSPPMIALAGRSRLRLQLAHCTNDLTRGRLQEEQKHVAAAAEDYETAGELKKQIAKLRAAPPVGEPESFTPPRSLGAVAEQQAEPEEPEPEPEQESIGTLPAGQLVLVTGLVGAKEHNDKRGVVRRFIQEKGRYQIQLADVNAKVIAVKPENLQLSTDYRDRDIVCVRGLIAAEHNGRKGCVRGLLNERNCRFQIELAATGFMHGALPLKRVWILPSNLELDVKALETCKLTAAERAEADEATREQEESMRHVQRLSEIRAIQRRNVEEGIGDAQGRDEHVTEMYANLMMESGVSYQPVVQGAPALAKGLDLEEQQLQVPSKTVEIEEECSLCLEPMPVGSCVAMLPGCGHLFHHSAIRPNARWAANPDEDACCGVENCLELTGSCPMCRQKVDLTAKNA